jgi:FkbM family methyltransferase
MTSRAKITIDLAEVDNIRFALFEPKEIIQSFWNIGKYYEGTLIEFIKENYKGGTFIDVGASIGNHTLVFSNLADNVISFEPLPIFYNHLIVNLLINEVINVQFYGVGLGNKHEVKTLYYDLKSCGGATFTKIDDYVGTYEVPIMKLDDFNIKDVKLIKIDVEGFEPNVLEGGINTINKYAPDLIVECDTVEIYDKVKTFIEGLNNKYYEYPKIFNNTPTYLFTTKNVDSFRGEFNDKNR